MMISSMVLFFRRDCTGGVGPAVDVPRFAFVHPALFNVLVVAAWVVAASVVAACVVACEAVDGALVPNKFDIDVGPEDVDCPLVPGFTVGSFVELVVLGTACLGLEKMLLPIGEEEAPRPSLLCASALKKLGAGIDACEEAVEENN